MRGVAVQCEQGVTGGSSLSDADIKHSLHADCCLIVGAVTEHADVVVVCAGRCWP